MPTKAVRFRKILSNQKAQNKNIENLNFVIREFAANKYYEVAEKLKRLWDANLRIPQEFITYEYLMRSKKVPTRDKHSRGSV